jgi:UTP--glucose-1-phosphate uridylyltransferase
MLGDDIVHSSVPCMKQMIDLFEKLQASIIATCEVPHSEIHQYGVIRGTPVDGFNGRVYRIQDVVEKPPASEAPSNLAIIGRYILTPEIFGILEKTRKGRGGEIQLTDGIRVLLEQQPVYAYMFEGTRYDASLLKTVVLKDEGPGLPGAFYYKWKELKNQEEYE